MQSNLFYSKLMPLFGQGLPDSKQTEGIEAIIAGCDQFEVTNNAQIAYILATAYWETGRTMQPIEEYGKGQGHKYGEKFKQNGQPYDTPDKIYYGRGLTQTTWYENYEMLTNQHYAKSKGWDFLNHPELLLEMEPSVWATIHCMWIGAYTGVNLSEFFNNSQNAWINARKIINGLDQAERIAGYAQIFFAAVNTI